MQPVRSHRRSFALLAWTITLLSGAAFAQQEAPPTMHVRYEHDSGWHENTGSAAAVVLSFPVIVEEASWMRLYFEETALAGDFRDGSGAILRMTALQDGAVQELDSRHLRQWQNSSAYFNGNTVLVEVIAQPDTGWSRLAMRSVDAGLSFSDRSICGPTDDRQLSTDARVARLEPIGCTGWLIDDCNNCMLTAGHCASGTSVAEFNVPMSNANGSLNHPHPDHQYSVDASSMQDNGGAGVGNDWAYYGCHPNPGTGLTPAQAQGLVFHLTAPPPVSGNDIRITGHGTDSTPNSTYNQVQQTHWGPMVTSTSTTVQYVTDTTGGNSGSPVIWYQTDEAVGIHTHGGCDASGGQNSGTASTHSGLQAALASPQGVCRAGIVPFGVLPTIVPPGVPVPLEVEVLGTPAAGTDVEAYYRYQGGSFMPLAMSSLGAGHYGVDLPAPACGDLPEYYFSYTDSACGVVSSPMDAPASFYSMAVGTVVATFEDNFETNQGWVAVNLGASTGDWQRGVPVNDPNWTYDPQSDSDGSGQCYVTENQLGNTDVDDGAVQLTSPVFDLSSTGDYLSYDYYLYLTDENSTDALLVEARADAGSWVVVADHRTNGSTSWRSHTITYADFVAAGVTPTAATEVRFTANDDNPQSINEAGVDAFFVGHVSCDSGLGMNYCLSGANGATISANGSASVAANDVELVASGVPVNQFGIFYYGDAQLQTPFGLGYRCVGGAGGIFRLNPPINSGPSGTLVRTLDLLNPPEPAALILPGSTWNFQGWFRDGTNFDLTDGLSISFLP